MPGDIRKAIDISVHLHHVTDRAYLVSDDGKESNAVWVPRSQCDDDYETADAGTDIELFIAEWLAEEKGLI